MPKCVAGASRIAGLIVTDTMLNTESHIIVPIILKERCTTAARFAFLLVPKEESIAVIQVPIFCPIIIGMAAPYDT